MDWANFIIFFMVYERIVAAKAAMDTRDCSSYMCTQVGFFDDYLAMGIVRQAKVYLSLCVCIQVALLPTSPHISQCISPHLPMHLSISPHHLPISPHASLHISPCISPHLPISPALLRHLPFHGLRPPTPSCAMHVSIRYSSSKC